ncbi:hypothetical protein J5X84_02860 [Streptosporangiaceae bacterium NEAU-GS5]|nr:hypothetical protein [Streptosporangiaceae bacterium NEAU-GS5]
MKMSWAERVIEALRTSSRPLDDDVLAFRLNASQRQTINQVCRRLEADGLIARKPGPDGKIVNILVADAPSAPDTPATTSSDSTTIQARRPTSLLTEDSVKLAVQKYLEASGWSVTVAWGRDHGIDIEAHRGHEHLYLEAKGEAANPAQQVNYFIGALGELVQRLRDPSASYGLALPDHPQYRRLAERLPPLARQRLNLVVMLVDRDDRSTITTLGPA